MSLVINQELKTRGVAQVIVVLKESARRPAVSAKACTAVQARESGSLGSLVRHFESSELARASQLVESARTRPLSPSARRGKRAASSVKAQVPGVLYYPHLGFLLGTATREGISKLRASAAVAKVLGAPTISLIRPRRKKPVKLTATLTWGLRSLRVERLWERGLSGKGVLVGHLDTGADGSHPALRGAIKQFAEFDDLGRLVAPAPRPYDTEDHGTHTAGTIAGRPVAGRHVGVAPGAKLASAIVIEGGNAVARVLGGMDWSVGQGVRILSMSLGFQGYLDDFVELTKLLRERGVLPVFAVGNEGPGESRSPGNYAEALSVGAHDRAHEVAYFSSSQRFDRKLDPIVPDLVAPGVAVSSAKPGGGYQASGRHAAHAGPSRHSGCRPRPRGAHLKSVSGPATLVRSMPSENAPRVDPSLLRELAEAEHRNLPLQAVFVLRRGEGEPPPRPEETEQKVSRLLQGASQETGEEPVAVNVFRNLNSFALEASPAFVRTLLRCRDVQSARSNRGPSPRIPAPERRG
jgi:subtilisin